MDDVANYLVAESQRLRGDAVAARGYARRIRQRSEQIRLRLQNLRSLRAGMVKVDRSKAQKRSVASASSQFVTVSSVPHLVDHEFRIRQK
jgi:hypothetical protein